MKHVIQIVHKKSNGDTDIREVDIEPLSKFDFDTICDSIVDHVYLISLMFEHAERKAKNGKNS